MVGFTLIPKGSEIAHFGNPAPYRVAGTYRELLSIVMALVNEKGFPADHDMYIIRGGTRVDWTRIPDEPKEIQDLKNELRSCRYRLQECLDKAWEFGGQYVGEEEFEEYDFVKYSREQIETIDKILSNG